MKEAWLVKKLVSDLASSRFMVILALVLYAPITVLNVAQPIMIGYAVHEFMAQKQEGLIFYVFIFFSAVMLLGCLEYIQSLSLQIAGQNLTLSLRQKAFSKMQALPLGFLDHMPVGKLITRLTSDAEAVMDMFSMGAVQIIGDCLFLLGTLIMLYVVDIKLSLITSLMLPVLALGVYVFRYWTIKAYRKVREVLSLLNGFIAEYLSGIAVVQMSGQLKKSHQGFDELNQQFLRANREAIFLDAAIYSFVDWLSYCCGALILFGAFKLEYHGALGLGVLVAFIESLSRFFQPIREFSNRYTIFQSGLVSLERIYEVFSWPEENLESGKNIQFHHQISFSDVKFHYKEGEPVLQHVSFTVARGERVALVGRTGAGKSTVIKLLNRFYPVSGGIIALDGHNINDISLSQIRDLIGTVPQEVFLFNGTIRENLTYAHSHASDAEVWHALDMVQLSDVVKWRGGLDSIIETRGVNWSLGERSLLALARALIKNPPILILDEATASIDAITQKKLQIATKNLLQDRTALVIAHRLSTIIDCDKILVFHEGTIIESGTHEQLLAQQGVYKSLITLQEF